MKALLRKGAYRIFRIGKTVYCFFLNLRYRWRLTSMYDVPVVINNFNRLTYPSRLLEFLSQCGFTRIIILDNHSDYAPLLQFYETCPYTVIRFDRNYGHLALWKSGLYHRYKWNYFVYTDPDVLPIEECPNDFIQRFKSELDRNRSLDKVGFGIKIDDLPDSFALKERVVKYEQGYWKNEVRPGVYQAPIDTTFALYRPLSALRGGEVFTLPAVRLGHPYLIRHLPWYVDSSNLSAEEVNYAETCNDSSSMGQHQAGVGSVY